MSATELREAARLMRDDWPSEHSNEIACEDYHPSAQFHQAVADGLDAISDYFDMSKHLHPGWQAARYHALAVARVYLGTSAEGGEAT